MARLIQKTLLGFLSTVVFFATFFLAGDILIAATAAVLTAIAQFVVSRSANINPGLPMLASLAVVIALTGFSLGGDDNFATTDPSQVSAAQPNCHCSALKPANPARVMQIPLHETPKALAPSSSRV